MPSIVSIHSFRGGTGKSNISANVAAVLAAEGKRVAVVDTDIQSPGIHVLFGVSQATLGHSLNEYLWGKCSIEEAAYDVTPPIDRGGKLYLIPSSIKPGDIAHIMREGYDVARLNEGFRHLIKALSLDVLIIDTHPGINEETLLAIALSNVLAIVLRPDQQDYEGTGVAVSIARRLRVPSMVLIVNKVPAVFDADEVKARMETTFECPVASVLPHSDDLMAFSSAGIFALSNPDHPLTEQYRQIAAALTGTADAAGAPR